MQRPNPLDENRKDLAQQIEAASNQEAVQELFEQLGEQVKAKTKLIIDQLARFMDEYREHGEIARINQELIENGRILKTLAEYAGLKERDPKRIAEKFAKGEVKAEDINMSLLARFQEMDLENAEADTDLNKGVAEFENLQAAYLAEQDIQAQYDQKRLELQLAGSAAASVVGQVLPRLVQQATELDEKKAALKAIVLPEDPQFTLEYEAHVADKKRKAQLEQSLLSLESQRTDDQEDQELEYAKSELLRGNEQTMGNKQLVDGRVQGLNAFCPSLFDLKRIAEHGRPALELYGNVKAACEATDAASVQQVIKRRLAYAQELSALLDVMCTTGNTSDKHIVKQFSADEVVVTANNPTRNILKAEGVNLSLYNPFKLLSNTRKAEYIREMSEVMRQLVGALQTELKVAQYAMRVQQGTALPAALMPEYLSDEALEAQIQKTTRGLRAVSERVRKGQSILHDRGGQLRWDDIEKALDSGRNNFLMMMEQLAVVVDRNGAVTDLSPENELPVGHRLTFNPDVKEFLPPALFAALSSLMSDEASAPALEGRNAAEMEAMLQDLIHNLDPKEMHEAFRNKLSEAAQKVQAAQAEYYRRWVLDKGVQVGKELQVSSEALRTELRKLDEMKATIYKSLNEARDVVSEITTTIGDRLKNAEEIKRAVTEFQTVVTRSADAMRQIGMKPETLITEDTARLFAGAALISRQIGTGSTTEGAELLIPMALDENKSNALSVRRDASEAVDLEGVIEEEAKKRFLLPVAPDSQAVGKLAEQAKQTFVMAHGALAPKAEEIVEKVRRVLFVEGAAMRESATAQASRLADDVAFTFNNAVASLDEYKALCTELDNEEAISLRAEQALLKARDFRKTKAYADRRQELLDVDQEENVYQVAKARIRHLEAQKDELQTQLNALNENSSLEEKERELETGVISEAITSIDTELSSLRGHMEDFFNMSLVMIEEKLDAEFEAKAESWLNARDESARRCAEMRAKKEALEKLLVVHASVCARIGGLYARMATTRELARNVTGMNIGDMGDLAEFFEGLPGVIREINRFIRTSNDRNFYRLEEAIHYIENVITPRVTGEKVLEEGEFLPQLSITRAKRDPEALLKGVRRAAIASIETHRQHAYLDEEVIDMQAVDSATAEGGVLFTPKSSEEKPEEASEATEPSETSEPAEASEPAAPQVPPTPKRRRGGRSLS